MEGEREGGESEGGERGTKENDRGRREERGKEGVE